MPLTTLPLPPQFQDILPALKPRRVRSLTDWTTAHRWIGDGPLAAETGAPVRWSHAVFPPAVAILQAIDDPRFSRVVVLGPPQAAKTETAAVNTILHRLSERRQACLYVHANAQKAFDQWHKKFLPALLSDEHLAELIPEDRELAGTRYRRDFTNGTSLFLAGSESIANLTGSTIPCIVCDDVQAMPPALGPLGHAVDVAEKRAAALPEHQKTLVLLGTAGLTTDYLWREMQRSTLYRYFVPCPACGTFQTLDWERLVFDASDPVKARADAFMRCAGDGCTHELRGIALPRLLAEGRWVSTAAGEIGRFIDRRTKGRKGATEGIHAFPDSAIPTRIAGFHYNALYWPFTSWAALAARWVETRGDPDAERDFRQHVLARPETPEADPEAVDLDALSVDELRAAPPDEYAKGSVPEGVEVITLTADVHDRFIYYIARGWRRNDGESWLIEAGRLGVHGPRKDETLSTQQHQAKVLAGVRAALEELWKRDQTGWPQGAQARHSRLALVDGNYLTDVVGLFCLQRGQLKWRSIRGRSGAGHGVRNIWNPQHHKDKFGRVYWDIGVDEAKLLLRSCLRIPAGAPGRWHTYSDELLETYHRHLASEQWLNRPGKDGQDRWGWVKREGGGPNHWLDCEAYQIAAAIAVGVKFANRSGDNTSLPPPPTAPRVRRREPLLRRPGRLY